MWEMDTFAFRHRTIIGLTSCVGFNPLDEFSWVGLNPLDNYGIGLNPLDEFYE